MVDSNILHIYKKYIQTMIYADDIKIFANDLDKYFSTIPDVFLNILELFLEENQNFMDKSMKNNAYEIITYFKEKKKNNNSTEIQEKINRIIRLINSSNSSKIEEYIIEEYSIRYTSCTLIFQALKLSDFVS